MIDLNFETSRLLLRPYAIEDAARLFEMNNDLEVLKYTGDAPFESIEATQEYITDYTSNPNNQLLKYEMGRMAVIEKKSAQFVGFCGIKTHESSQITDIGYRFLRDQWGKGYATEACKEILKFAFDTHHKQQIVAHVHELNIGSQKVAEKLNFKLDHRFLWDGVLSGRYYKLTKDAYYN